VLDGNTYTYTERVTYSYSDSVTYSYSDTKPGRHPSQCSVT
jgi:hypothetical protein